MGFRPGVTRILLHPVVHHQVSAGIAGGNAKRARRADEDVRMVLANATPGGKRYAEVTGMMQVANLTVRYTAFGAAPQGCQGDIPMLPDVANLAQVQFQKLQT